MLTDERSIAARTGVRIGSVLHTALLLPVDMSDARVLLAELVEDQTQRILDNLQAILTASGAGRRDVLHARLYVVGYKRFSGRIRRVFDRFFEDALPVVVELGVSELPRGALVAMEFVVEHVDPA